MRGQADAAALARKGKERRGSYKVGAGERVGWGGERRGASHFLPILETGGELAGAQ